MNLNKNETRLWHLDGLLFLLLDVDSELEVLAVELEGLAVELEGQMRNVEEILVVAEDAEELNREIR